MGQDRVGPSWYWPIARGTKARFPSKPSKSQKIECPNTRGYVMNKFEQDS